MMEKLDLNKFHKAYYTAKTTPTLVDFDEANYISIAGSGDPAQTEFADKVQALYAVAYAVKFQCKLLKKDFVVPKLEGLWWFEDEQYKGLTISEAPKIVKREAWKYRLLIRMPDFVNEAIVDKGKVEVKHKKNLNIADSIALFKLNEGSTVQILHVGPFDKEPVTLLKLEEFIKTHRLQKAGLHHEIYLSDFRKTPQEKLKTILREPVGKLNG